MKINTTVRFEQKEREELDATSVSIGMSFSDVVRLCVKRSLPTLRKSYGGARRKFLEELKES
jgi:hypothetical protein